VIPPWHGACGGGQSSWVQLGSDDVRGTKLLQCVNTKIFCTTTEISANWVKIILQDNRQLLKVDEQQLSLKSETAEWHDQRIANLQNLQTRQARGR